MTTTLTGSERQVIWAESLRNDAVTFYNAVLSDLDLVLAGELEIDDYTNINVNTSGQVAKAEYLKSVMVSRRNAVLGIATAREVIDTRDTLPVWSDHLAANNNALVEVWNNTDRLAVDMVAAMADGIATYTESDVARLEGKLRTRVKAAAMRRALEFVSSRG